MEAILRFVEEKGKYIVYSLLGLVVILLMVIFWLFFQNDTKDMAPEMDIYEELLMEESEEDVEVAENAEEGNTEVENTGSKEVVVDVKGAVNAPGVYTMVANSRIVDAIEKAGGLVENAEQNAVNLAQVIEDQMVIYVPEVGEEGVEVAGLNQASVGEEEDSATKININTAEKEALMTLNGIGDSKADSILTYREENGNFKTIEDIKNVSGIGDATFENLKEFIIVGP